MTKKLLVMFSLTFLLWGCGASDNSSLNNQAIEERYLVEALQELADSTRGEFTVDSVDYICAYAYVSGTENSEVELEFCAYFLEIKRGNDVRYASASLGKYSISSDATTTINDQFKEADIVLSQELLDFQYSLVLSTFRSTMDQLIGLIDDDLVISKDSDIIQGSISSSSIQRAMRSVSQ